MFESFSEHRFFYFFFFNPHFKLRQGKMKFYLWHLKAKWLDWLDWAVTLLNPVMRSCHCWAFFFLFQWQGGMPKRSDTCVTQIQHRAPCFKTLNSPIEILPVPLFSCSVHDTAKTCLFHMLWITIANRQRSAFESNIQHFSFRMGFAELWVQFTDPLTIRQFWGFILNVK